MIFVIALNAEAGPIIDLLKLKRSDDKQPYPLFSKEPYHLIVTGIGKSNARKATAFLVERFAKQNQPWINFGMAGHGKMEVGECFLANRIFDQQGEKTFFPPQLLKTDFPSSALMTCSTPVDDYPEPIGYDMEASAFCSTALQASTRELIQVVKVVSDNPKQPLDSFDRAKASSLIAKGVPSLLSFASKLDDLAKEITPSAQLLSVIREALCLQSFSETQGHQVRKLITHCHALGLPPGYAIEFLQKASSAKQAISNLHSALEQHRILL